MRKTMIIAALAAFAFAGAASAETVDALRQPAIDWCNKEMAGNSDKPEEVAKTCTCLIDQVVKNFGDDAPKMLKILAAGLNPSDVDKIAELLGVSAEEAKAFIDKANPLMETSMNACEPA